jgi:EmrB/QacA subfamily drug resistance transporter
MELRKIEKDEISDDGERGWMLPVLVAVIGVFMAFLDSNAVNVAISTMMAEFKATTAGIEWVTTAYMLTAAIVLPMSGWLNDRLGAKRLYLMCLVIFTAGSALCALSWTLPLLIAARIIQALGGGMMMATVMSMVFRLIPKDKTGFGMGIFGIAMMVAPAIAPTLGGFLVEYASWRWIFLVNVPVGILGVIVGIIVIPEFGRTTGRERFDWIGAALSAVGFGSLLFTLSKANDWGWGNFSTLGMLCLSLGVIAAFLIRQMKAAHPLLDLSVFKVRGFTMTMIALAITSIGIVAGLFYIPLFLQIAQGRGAMETGMALLSSALISGVMMPISGKLYDKFGAKGVLLIGVALLALTTWLFAGIAVDTTMATVNIWLIVRGVAMGMLPLQAAALADIPPPLVAQATAILQVVRNLAGSFGISLTTVFVTQRISVYTGGHSRDVLPFVRAIDDVFLLTAPFILVAIIPILQMKGKGLMAATEEAGTHLSR